MNINSSIIFHGFTIEIVKGGFKIKGYEHTTFTTLDLAKQHIQMTERAIPSYQYVNGRQYEISKVMSVGIIGPGKYGLSVQYKERK